MKGKAIQAAGARAKCAKERVEDRCNFEPLDTSDSFWIRKPSIPTLFLIFCNFLCKTCNAFYYLDLPSVPPTRLLDSKGHRFVSSILLPYLFLNTVFWRPGTLPIASTTLVSLNEAEESHKLCFAFLV